MNTKYQRYIEYIVNDLETPYFNNMKEMYGLKDDEYEMVLSKVFKQPVSIVGRSDYHNRNVYDNIGNKIYFENTDGGWIKYEYDEQGREIYFEDNYGNWERREYNGNEFYLENHRGYWQRSIYDDLGNEIYYEDSDGGFEDNR